MAMTRNTARILFSGGTTNTGYEFTAAVLSFQPASVYDAELVTLETNRFAADGDAPFCQ